ncbi:MAG: response regulator [Myxococcales bacterium]|nr:response regulator [Myxococcales bacterium]
MHERTPGASLPRIAELAARHRALVEKALYMRCQRYLANVKSLLLVETLDEVDATRQHRALDHEPDTGQRRLAEIARREASERHLDRQRRLADAIHRGLTHFLLHRDQSSAQELLLDDTAQLIGATFAILGEVLEGGGGAIRRALTFGPQGPRDVVTSARELDAAILQRLFGGATASASGEGGDLILDPALPVTAGALLLPLVLGSGERGFCVLGGLAEPASGLLGLVAPLASPLGALDLADALDRRAEDQRALAAQAHAEAALANQSKSLFLANMSHELRTPLNTIAGLCHILEDGSLSGEQLAHVRRIKDASDVLLDLVDDVLDFSKIEAGKLTLEIEVFELDAAIERLVSLYQPRAAARGLELQLERAPELPAQLVGDRLRIHQILSNLLSNAVKFTPTGRVVLRIDAEPAPGEGRVTLRFAVEDTGIGIAPERIAGLFDPFAQGDPSSTRAHGGTGLGLAICRRLAKLMDGTLSAVSAPGEGSTFTFIAAFEVAEHPPALPIDVTAALRGLRVLVVEDMPMNQLVIEAILAADGIDVTVVDRGAAAIDAVAGGARFDAILMDIQMPEMDGYEATRRLRELPGAASTPILAMTAHVRPEDRARCLAAGMNEHLSKPIEVDTVRAALARWTRAAGEER